MAGRRADMQERARIGDVEQANGVDPLTKSEPMAKTSLILANIPRNVQSEVDGAGRFVWNCNTALVVTWQNTNRGNTRCDQWLRFANDACTFLGVLAKNGLEN